MIWKLLRHGLSTIARHPEGRPFVSPLVGAYRRMRATCAVRGFRRSQFPVWIYQMGKVGSSTVHRSIKEAQLSRSVYYLHTLDPMELALSWQAEQKNHPLGPPYHLHLSRVLRRRLRTGPSECRVVTGVRDPIAREISLVFDTPHLQDASLRDERGRFDVEKTVRFLHQKLHQERTYRFALGWFEREIQSHLGVDVYSSDFDRHRGWTRIDKGNVSVLVYQTESLDALFPTVLADFLESSSPIPIKQDRVRSSSPDARAYERVKEQLELRPELCKKIYQSRLVRHFYSDETIESWVAKWTR